MIRHPLTYCLLLLLLASGCTNARWMIQNEQRIDPNDYSEVSSRQFPDAIGNVTPDNPVLRLQVYSESTYRYAEKILVARYIQDYKIRPVFLALGVLGGGLTFYLANSEKVPGIDGNLEKITLNVLGGIIALSSAANLKPDGEPRPTGEERFLRQTGTRTVVDTVQVTNPIQDSAMVDISYGDQRVVENRSVDVSGGTIEIELGLPLSNLGITDRNPDSVHVSVGYADSTYSFGYSLSSVLRPFARVETSVTELRNSPEESPANVLAELVQGSQLEIIDEAGDRWYKVLYGIQENYLLKNEVSQVWRTPDFEQGNRVVAIPSLPFGDIDVENNIPVLTRSNEHGIGLIIGNEDYSGAYTPRKYTERDTRLIETYLTDALGYASDRVFKAGNIGKGGSYDALLDSLGNTATDSSDIFVYVGGFGKVEYNNTEFITYLLGPSAEEDSSIVLMDLINSISGLPFSTAVVVLELGLNHSVQQLENPGGISLYRQALHNRIASVTSINDNMAVLFSSDVEQRSQIYLGDGEDKKHHIFPYFFAKALQDRLTVISEIYQYLQRNVSYTSRRLHDQPQDPILFGDQAIDLADSD